MYVAIEGCFLCLCFLKEHICPWLYLCVCLTFFQFLSTLLFMYSFINVLLNLADSYFTFSQSAFLKLYFFLDSSLFWLGLSLWSAIVMSWSDIPSIVVLYRVVQGISLVWWWCCVNWKKSNILSNSWCSHSFCEYDSTTFSFQPMSPTIQSPPMIFFLFYLYLLFS